MVYLTNDPSSCNKQNKRSNKNNFNIFLISRFDKSVTFPNNDDDI